MDQKAIFYRINNRKSIFTIKTSQPTNGHTFSMLYVVHDSSFSVCKVLANRFGSDLLVDRTGESRNIQQNSKNQIKDIHKTIKSLLFRQELEIIKKQMENQTQSAKY